MAVEMTMVVGMYAPKRNSTTRLGSRDLIEPQHMPHTYSELKPLFKHLIREDLLLYLYS